MATQSASTSPDRVLLEHTQHIGDVCGKGCPGGWPCLAYLQAVDLVAAERQTKRMRKSLGAMTSAYLRLLMEQKLDDGTPLLQVVLDADPELEARLRGALTGGNLTKSSEDELEVSS